jgi:serine/threonine-protein phosphatase 2B catalytic subunit
MKTDTGGSIRLVDLLCVELLPGGIFGSFPWLDPQHSIFHRNCPSRYHEKEENEMKKGLLIMGFAQHHFLPQVQAPAMFLPTSEQFFSSVDPTKPDIAFLKNHFYREGRLTEEQALYILEK